MDKFMMKKSTLSLLPLLLLSFACSSEPPIDEAGKWEQYALTDSPPRRDLLLACEYAIQRAGYPRGKTDAARGTVYSDWLIDLQPFRNNGRRYKAIFRVFDDAGAISVRTRVIAERNIETNETLESGAAEWEELGDDQGRSRTLMQYLRSQLYLRDS
jgi:hypothetical protein